MSNIIRATFLGFLGWVAAWVLVYLLRDTVFNEGNPWLILVYLLTFPLGYVFTLVMQKLMNVPMKDMLNPMVIIAIVPLILDGLSFSFTKVYGAGSHEIYTAGFLLWAPGVFLIVALGLIERAKKLSI